MMDNKRFFPNRVWQFLLVVLLAMVASAPLFIMLGGVATTSQTHISYAVICAAFLLIVGAINWKRKVDIFGYYTRRLDSLWLAILIVVLIQLCITIPFSVVLDVHNAKDDNLWITAIGAILLAPIFEESIFRGVFLRGLLTRYPETVSIVITAIVFALIHVRLPQMVPGLMLGLLFGVVFARTHSLIYTMLLHSVANAIIIVSGLLPIAEFYSSLGKITLIIICVASAAVVVSLSKVLIRRISR